MARALLSKPRLILIEEITAKLDQTSQTQLNKAINNIIAHARGNELTVVIATDSLVRVEQSDRVVYV